MNKAREFAIFYHGDQKYGEDDYVVHLDRVNQILVAYGRSDLESEAYLHDIIEDTDVTFEWVSENFGPEVAMRVWACTGVGANRKEKQAEIKRRLRIVPSACPVKAADRIANVTNCIKSKNERMMKLYESEMNDFIDGVIEHVEYDMVYLLEVLHLGLKKELGPL